MKNLIKMLNRLSLLLYLVVSVTKNFIQKMEKMLMLDKINYKKQRMMKKRLQLSYILYNTFSRYVNISCLCKEMFVSIIILSSLFLQVSYAQTQARVVTGNVIDSSGAPLEGATISLKGSKSKVIADAKGMFNIKVLSESSILVVSFSGYTDAEQIVGNKLSFTIRLYQKDDRILDDIVVIGYGSVKKKDATGSVAKVSVADLQKAPVRSFEEALAGRVAGVQVTSTDGQPGDALNIIIRGNNSVTGNNSPLYVIDGFPIENPNNNVINPAEIESIDILKDASATAIYGARGANGVIVITTKKGKIGPPVISFNTFTGLSTVTRRMSVMNPYDFVKLQLELSPITNSTAYLTRSNRTLDDYKNVKGLDFQDALFRNGIFTNHDLSIKGGNDQTKYSISGSYTNQQGVVIASAFKRGQGRITLDQKLSKKLKVGINTNYSFSESNGTTPRNQTSAIGGNDVSFNLLQNVWSYRPVSGGVDSLDADLLNELADPDAFPGDPRVNPLFSARNEYNKRLNSTFVGNIYLEWDITKDLKFRSTGGLNLSRASTEIFNNTKTRGGSPLTTQGQQNGVNGSILNVDVNDFVNENTLTFTKRFNKNHVLTALGIYSIQYNKTKSTGLAAIKVPNEALGIAGLDEGQVSSITSTGFDFGLQSFATRLNYSLFSKYLFTASLRADGSSKFDPNGPNQYGIFPSGAFAWKLGDEGFMKKIKAISSAKFRASYGITGNNRIGPFDYLSQITFYNNRNAFYTYGNALTQAFAVTQLGNPKLKWESTSQLDMGLELGFLKNRILLEVDVYRKQTNDLLLNSNLAPNSGFTNQVTNIGKTQNEGLEFTLNTINISNKNFNWSSSFNISFNRNKIIALNESDDRIISIASGQGNQFGSVPNYIAKIGLPISSFYGFKYIGNYQLNDFDLLPNGVYVLKDNIPHAGGSANVTRANQKPGDPRYADINGDGLVNDNDLTIIGNPNPLHIGGLTNNFSYKNFDLNIFFQWSYGNDVYNFNRVILEGGAPLGASNSLNQFASYNDRWNFDNPSNKNFRAFAINGQYANGVRVTSSRVVEDGSFLRLKTVQLGYNFPSAIIKRSGFKSIRLYSSAQNIFTWTNYSGMDPEVNTRGTGLTSGWDFSAYPRALTFTLGINVTL